MYPASKWRIPSGALDDDTHAPVLTNPSVTGDTFSPSGFPARHWAVLFVFFSPQQILVELCLTSAVVAVEKWKAFCAFQAQRLFHGHQAAARCGSG
jgi:hypothetical protein